METIINLGIILGIPIIFFVLFVRNVIKISRIKKDNGIVKKSLIIKSIIFAVIFILIVILYIWLIYSLSTAIANM